MGDLKKIGALWIREGKAGKFFTGEIEINGMKIPLLIFNNRYKEQEKQPDYQIFLGDDKKPKAKKEFPVEVQQAEIDKGQSIATKRLQEIREKIAKNDFMGEEDVPFL